MTRDGWEVLTCHRHAPQLVVLQSRDGITRLTEWPPVSPAESCGDHFPREVPRGTVSES